MEKIKVLIDAMRDGIDEELNKLDYEAYSVKKLVDKGEKLRSDYSILKRAEQNNMILVTEDIDNIIGCIENDIDCVEFGQNHTVEYLINELEKIKLRRLNSPATFTKRCLYSL